MTKIGETNKSLFILKEKIYSKIITNNTPRFNNNKVSEKGW